MEIKEECLAYLGQYYKELFFGTANKRYRSMTGADLKHRLNRLSQETLNGVEKPNELNDIHAMFAKVCAYLMHKEERLKPGPALDQLKENWKKMEDFCGMLAAKDMEYLPELTEEELEHVLKMQGIRRYLLTNSLERAYQLFYLPKTIKKGIRESVKRRPEDEYPETRAMKRRFILHIGPTNSGKTHDALERLKTASHGAYFGPLRLLALEVYDRLNGENIPCSMITGEETLEVAGACCQACTVEMLNEHEYFDVAVVDECQMVADPYRGHNWTRAVLGLRAEEIHLCMAPEAEDIIVQMIKRCGDTFKIVRHKRNTRLTLEEKPYSLKKDLKKGDALIVFSKKSVLALAAHLENQGVHCSVIYGSLPPATRREQVRRFLEKETEVVVSTDAIGMGLNLPIRRIVFIETRKFDGVGRRSLLPEEIKQIAVDGAKLVKQLSEEYEGNFLFEYSPESFTGTEVDYAVEVCNAVLDIMQPTPDRPMIINLPVTVEMSMPHVYANQIEYCDKHLKYRDSVIISTHPHNDRGTGVACAELAVLAGAQRVECCLFGNGERTGNVDAVTLAMNMYSHGVDPKLDFSDMPAICATYERVTRMHIYERTPYAGQLVFAAFSGSHQDAIAKGMAYRKEKGDHRWTCPYIPVDPHDIGRTYDADVIRINSQSGKGGIGFVLEQNYGYNLPAKMREALGYKVKSVSDHSHKELSAGEVLHIFEDTFLNKSKPLSVVEAHFAQVNGITATVTLDLNGQRKVVTSVGNGRLDAVANAIQSATGMDFHLETYSEHSLDEGSTSRAASYVGLEWGDGIVTWGAGTDTDIIVAGIHALVSAINNK